MSAAGAGPVAPVSKPGKCERILCLGKEKHVIRHEWRLNKGSEEVLLTTTLVDKKTPNRPTNKHQVYVENTEESVTSKALEMAHSVLKNKRERWEKAQGHSSSSSSGGGATRNADREVADPVMAALREGRRTRSRVVLTIQPAEPQSPENFLASMDCMGYDNALRHLENIGSTFAKDTRKRLRELEAKASTVGSLERAIEKAQKQRRTNEGSRTLQTILTAAAFPVDDVEASSISVRRRAATLGVREHAFKFAAERAKKLLSDLHPTEAIKRGVYWFWPRATK
ncbi:unnamed protein product [Ectocarpus sp. 12 AP-2014]